MENINHNKLIVFNNQQINFDMSKVKNQTTTLNQKSELNIDMSNFQSPVEKTRT